MRIAHPMRAVVFAFAGCAVLCGVLFQGSTAQSESVDPNAGLTAGGSRLGLAPPIPAVGEIGGPGRVLDAMEMEQWLRGREVFDRDFHQATGLGAPGFNADSCRACHGDPVLGGSGGLELNVSRFGNDNGGSGPFMDLPGGQGLSKLSTPWDPVREEYDPTTADVFEQRQTPALFGAGLIDSIPESEILAQQGTGVGGVFGVARIIDTGMTMEVGRFGWKAQIPRLEDFTRDALASESGITADDDGRGFTLVSDADGASDPELNASDLEDLVFFLKELGPPPRAGSTDPQVVVGEALFASVGCAICHTPTLMGADGPVPLFSNLLLHDVHSSSFRGMSEPGAGIGVYRTPPLWGLRFTAPYMHDGRAETPLDAILFHAGEASTARSNFLSLGAADREALLAFLADL